MLSTIQLFVGLLVVISIIAFVAVRLKVPASILLVMGGVALGLPSAVPNVELSPEVVLLLVLPPIIYSASVAMSWNEFKSNLRPISLLAIGCVVFTASAVAAATHYWMAAGLRARRHCLATGCGGSVIHCAALAPAEAHRRHPGRRGLGP